MLEIIDVDFNNPEHGRQVLAMLDEYASGPMGGNTPLPAHVHRDLIPELARRPTARARCWPAWMASRPAWPSISRAFPPSPAVRC